MAEEGFFEVMKDAISAIAPGLQNFGAEMGAEISRMGTQGAAEIASALFGGSDAYVAYGQGQQTPAIEGQAVEAPQMERGGMEM